MGFGLLRCDVTHAPLHGGGNSKTIEADLAGLQNWRRSVRPAMIISRSAWRGRASNIAAINRSRIGDRHFQPLTPVPALLEEENKTAFTVCAKISRTA